MFLVTQTVQANGEEPVEMLYTRTDDRARMVAAAAQAMVEIANPEYTGGFVTVLSVRVDWEA